jgi:type VI secretion system secreted protein VgrG
MRSFAREWHLAALQKTGVALVLMLFTGVSAKSQVLGTASDFGVLGASAVTNTGPTVVTGDLGIYPGTSITGFPPGSVLGTIHNSDAVAMQAQKDALAGYGFLAAEAPTQNLTGQDLGGLTLLPGVYKFNTSAQLTGQLTLNGLGDPNADFVFQIGSTLTTASASSVLLEGDTAGGNVFWDVGSSATLGTTTMFQGSVIAVTSATLTTGATDPCGGIYALNGAVTMDTNTIGGGCGAQIPGGPTPEPSTLAFLGCLGMASTAVLWRRRRT